MLRYDDLMRDADRPKTFACHHFAETCGNCEGLVRRWKSERANRSAELVDDVAGQLSTSRSN